MVIQLSKGGNLSLSKTDPSLKHLIVGLGWDAADNGHGFDLDASAFMLGDNGKIRGDSDFIFYNQLTSPCGAVTHTGDNRTGDGDGDDESLKVHLDRVPSDIQRIVICVTIHDDAARRQHFGQVGNAFIRLINEDTRIELARFDLSEDYDTETAMMFGEIYRRQNEWKFRAIGQGFSGGLEAMCAQFGVDVI